MKKLTFLFVLGLSVVATKAQTSSGSFSYFLKDGSPAPNEKSASYLMNVTKVDDTTWLKKYYNIYGPMIYQETYSDESLNIKHGKFIWYNEAGYIDSAGNYLSNNRHSEWVYKKDTSVLLVRKYDNGNLICTFDPKTKKIILGNNKEASPAELKNIDTTTTIFTTVQAEAEATGGKKGWQNYLVKNIVTPKRLQKIVVKQKKGIYYATVIVGFIIDKNGNVGQFYMDKSYEWSADMEAIRVIKDGGIWKPAMQNGQIVDCYERQQITYAIEVRGIF